MGSTWLCAQHSTLATVSVLGSLMCAQIAAWTLYLSWFPCTWRQANSPISQIPQCTCTISHNVPFRTEMGTFLFWMVHCGILARCTMGFVRLSCCQDCVTVYVHLLLQACHSDPCWTLYYSNAIIAPPIAEDSLLSCVTLLNHTGWPPASRHSTGGDPFCTLYFNNPELIGPWEMQLE